MDRTIVVKGLGKVSVNPDLTVIGMTLAATDKKYDRAMETASAQIEDLRAALLVAGFEKSDLKTTDFNVRSRYESVKDQNGNYQNVFAGFEVDHSLKLEFDFDMNKLNEVLTAIANCKANPRFSIGFSVKDQSAVKEALLVSEVENATQRAKILAKAAGVRLGALQKIDYNWGELQLVSPTAYKMEEKCLAARCAPVDIHPDNINVSDTVTLVWEIA